MGLSHKGGEGVEKLVSRRPCQGIKSPFCSRAITFLGTGTMGKLGKVRKDRVISEDSGYSA